MYRDARRPGALPRLQYTERLLAHAQPFRWTIPDGTDGELVIPGVIARLGEDKLTGVLRIYDWQIEEDYLRPTNAVLRYQQIGVALGWLQAQYPGRQTAYVEIFLPTDSPGSRCGLPWSSACSRSCSGTRRRSGRLRHGPRGRSGPRWCIWGGTNPATHQAPQGPGSASSGGHRVAAPTGRTREVTVASYAQRENAITLLADASQRT